MKISISPEEENVLREHFETLQKIFVTGDPYKALIKALKTFPHPHNIIAQQKYSGIKIEKPFNSLTTPKEKIKSVCNFIEVLLFLKIDIPKTPKPIQHLIQRKGKKI